MHVVPLRLALIEPKSTEPLRLIIVCGLPGCGKSSIAEHLGIHLSTPVFAKDVVEAALLRSGAATKDSLGAVGYELLTTLARRQLLMGQSAILDSVASTSSIRTIWHGLAAEFGADWSVIECICSHREVHRQRIIGRARGIPGWHELEWSDVERTLSNYAPWSEDRLVLDCVDDLESNQRLAMKYLAERP